MGNVGISIKIMPKTPEEDLDRISKDISKKFNIQDSRIEEIGFGVKALKIMIVRPDGTGGTDDIEEFIKNVSGVETIEIVDVSLI